MDGTPTLISDLGDVIVLLDFAPLRAFLERKTGRAADEIWPVVHEEGSWRRLETGHISIGEYARLVGETIGAPVAADEFRRVWCSIFPGIDAEVHALYMRWRAQGRPLVALTNTNAPHMKHLRATYEQLSVFDRIFSSHEIGARKPDPASFDHVLARVGAAAEDCIFVDDRPENIEVARDLGMKTILARGAESIRAGLEAINGGS